MRPNLPSAILLAGLFATLATARPPSHSPAAGSLERRQILDAVRPAIERRLGAPVSFVVSDLRVAGNWAILTAQPQRPDGKPIDWRRYMAADDYEIGGIEVSAVIERRGKRWVLIDSAIGATDAWYCGLKPVDRLFC